MNKVERRPGELASQGHSDWGSLLEKELKKKAPSRLPEELAGLLEKAMREQRRAEDSGEAPAAAHSRKEPLPERLIAELRSAQERSRGMLVADAQPAPARPRLRVMVRAGVHTLRQMLAASGVLAGKVRRLRLRDWRGHYLMALSRLHRLVFDRRIERLLFIKTAGPYSSMEPTEDGRKAFRYRGPVPGMVLGWALSALPSDLKRYAFADLRAGNGRTLLLASARNFEHATGYAFDSDSCAVLEMNLAQYSRSYMACRDVRASRGDREGMSIPLQPAVLFVPESLGEGHLRIALGHLAASIRLNPRALYLIFENSGLECELEQMLLFRKVPLPLLSRLKLRLFSPSNIAVYKSLNSGEAG